MDPKANGTKNSAEPANLFTVRGDFKKLDAEKAEKFHSIVAKLLFATKRARPDIVPDISYLTTRVIEPDKDDWSNLAHLMKHIRGTLKLTLTITANVTGVLKWWID